MIRRAILAKPGDPEDHQVFEIVDFFPTDLGTIVEVRNVKTGGIRVVNALDLDPGGDYPGEKSSSPSECVRES